MWDIALRNRPLDRNDGRNVKRSAYVSGSGRDFCDGELNFTKTTRTASRFSIYIGLLDVLESRVMKITSISYCAVWENSRADILGSGRRACELEFNYTKPTHPVSRFYLYILYIQPPNHSHCEWFPQCLLDVIESRVMKRTSISYCAVW